ncbi:MAG: hypothetical protein Q4B79_03040 [Moraxella sp.]|uniref:hypothetical protein n=1 Tax=Moraxella sp. TaxID=479 RepID=UPI0026DBED1A|nr:hypothetical protein [Moraxella sp.]MDO4449918.1 hypothetical protein [Moraxella sp.]
MSKSIHASLKRVLDVSGQSVEEIALLADVSMTTVMRWSKHGISQAGAKKLSKILGVSPEWILTGRDADKSDAPKPSTPKSKSKPRMITPREALLEFVEVESGVLVLREMGDSEALVKIEFADKVKELLGQENLQGIGQHMISAAIASVMERQMRQYHAHVYDEKPKRFS